MRERVTVERVQSTADGAGGFTRAWTTWKTLWASVRTERGNEVVITDGLQPVITYSVVTRYQPEIGIEHRLVWKGQTLNIRSAADMDGARQWTIIAAEAGVIAA